MAMYHFISERSGGSSSEMLRSFKEKMRKFVALGEDLCEDMKELERSSERGGSMSERDWHITEEDRGRMRERGDGYGERDSYRGYRY